MVDFAFARVVLGALVGWLSRRQQEAMAYLLEENRILRRQLRGRRLRLTDDERRRLAVRGHRLGRRALREVATIVTPGYDSALASATLAVEAGFRYAVEVNPAALYGPGQTPDCPRPSRLRGRPIHLGRKSLANGGGLSREKWRLLPVRGW